MSLGPAALVRSLPGALRREPADELVLVGVSSMSPDAAVVVTVDLSGLMGEDDAEDAAQAVYEAVTAVAHDGATKMAVVVYADDTSPDSIAARFAATAVVAAEAAGLDVLDAIAVSGGRWRSFDCTNPSCCPPDGTPITEGPTP